MAKMRDRMMDLVDTSVRDYGGSMDRTPMPSYLIDAIDLLKGCSEIVSSYVEAVGFHSSSHLNNTCRVTLHLSHTKIDLRFGMTNTVEIEQAFFKDIMEQPVAMMATYLEPQGIPADMGESHKSRTLIKGLIARRRLERGY